MQTLRDGLIHVWLVHPRDLLGQAEVLTSYLSNDERVRASGYKLEAPRIQFQLARGFLRKTLASYLAVAPESLRFGTTGNEKPVLVSGDDLHFNLSHTANTIALAVARDRPVGIDVEQLQTRRSMFAIAKQQFHAAEQNDLEAACAEQKLAVFYRIWTCKEAYLKGLGLGFAQSLTSFALQINGTRYCPSPSLDDQQWSVHCEVHSPASPATEGKDAFALAIASTGDWQFEYRV